jgi:hypothetical protein
MKRGRQSFFGAAPKTDRGMTTTLICWAVRLEFMRGNEVFIANAARVFRWLLMPSRRGSISPAVAGLPGTGVFSRASGLLIPFMTGPGTAVNYCNGRLKPHLSPSSGRGQATFSGQGGVRHPGCCVIQSLESTRHHIQTGSDHVGSNPGVLRVTEPHAAAL